MRKDGVNLQRNTRGQFAAKCGGQIARNIQLSYQDSILKLILFDRKLFLPLIIPLPYISNGALNKQSYLHQLIYTSDRDHQLQN